MEISDSLLAYYFMQANTTPNNTQPDPVQAALCSVDHGLNSEVPCDTAPSVHQEPAHPDLVAGVTNLPDIRKIVHDVIIVDDKIATRSIHDSIVPDGTENVAP